MRYEYLLSDTIHEINRQKAEIEDLQDLMVKYNGDFAKQEAEIEKLQNEYRWLDQESSILSADVTELSERLRTYEARNKALRTERNRLNKELKTAKAEAYKEFAEKLNKMLNSRASFSNLIESITCESIVKDVDNILKELVGEDKCNKNFLI